MLRIIFLITGICCSFLSVLKAQDRNRMRDLSMEDTFREQLKDINADYTAPEGWIPLEDKQLYLPNSTVGPVGQFYNLSGKDSIIVSLGIYYVRGESDSLANANYLNAWNGRDKIRDSVASFKKIPEKKLKQIHATLGVTYEPEVKKAFRKRYHYVKTMILQRRDIGGFYVNFLSKDSGQKSAINRLIQNTWGMLRFKSDSLFEPDFKRSDLVGKYRYLRPQLNTGDSLQDLQNEKKGNYDERMAVAWRAVKEENYVSAKRHFLAAHQILPKAKMPYQQLFLMYYPEQLDSAMKYWHQLQQNYLPDGKLENWLNRRLGWVYESKGKPDSAEMMYEKCIENLPDFIPNYRDLALFYKRQKQYHKAIETLQEGIAANKKYPRSIYLSGEYNQRIAQCYEVLSDTSAARKFYVQAQDDGQPLSKEILNKYHLSQDRQLLIKRRNEIRNKRRTQAKEMKY